MVKDIISKIFIIIGIVVFALHNGAMASQKDFDAYLQKIKSTAHGKGLDYSIVYKALHGLTLNETVVNLDRKQSEFTTTFQTYLNGVASDSRAKQAAKFWKQNRDVLQEISNRYGVPPQYILALWGV